MKFLIWLFVAFVAVVCRHIVNTGHLYRNKYEYITAIIYTDEFDNDVLEKPTIPAQNLEVKFLARIEHESAKELTLFPCDKWGRFDEHTLHLDVEEVISKEHILKREPASISYFNGLRLKEKTRKLRTCVMFDM
jgi:hypothetical protein